jgi:selenocysteine lyase/cysteine desulfurase/dTDP-4-dehydrorhamnose reductase
MMSQSTLLEVEFSIPSSILYLNTAGSGILPQSVARCGEQQVLQKQTPWKPMSGTAGDTRELRELFAGLIEAHVEDIAIAPSTAFAMTLVARSVQRQLQLNSGEVVVVLEQEMASAVYPWQTVCMESNSQLEVILASENYPNHDWTEDILQLFDNSDKDIAVLALPQVHWCDGTFIDLERISKRMDRYALEHVYRNSQQTGRRPLLIVDGTQSIGALPFSVAIVQPDFVACSVHKWLLGPYGMSLMYIHPRHREHWQPLDLHERGRLGSNESSWDEVIPFRDSRGFPTEFFPDNRRFDAGGRPNVIIVPMVTQALRVLRELQPTKIQQHCHQLAQLVRQGLVSVVNILEVSKSNNRTGHILGIKVSSQWLKHGLSVTWLAEELEKANVFVSVRGERLRVSFYVYNSVSDAHKFVVLILQLLVKFKERALPTRKILVTGAHGWLAQFATQKLIQKFSGLEGIAVRVIGTFSQPSKPPTWLLPENSVFLNLTQENNIRLVVEDLKPDAVLHLAAISSPVQCHADPSTAQMVNSPEVLVTSIRELCPKTLFVFASTDMVFDGEHAPYSVSAVPQPVNVYGSTKRDFEDLVLHHLPNGVVLRLSNMIGKPFVFEPAGVKFLQFLVNCHRQRKLVGLKSDELRSFVNVDDVLYIMINLIDEVIVQGRSHIALHNSSKRTFNVGGPIGLSRLELAATLASALSTTLRVVNDDDSPNNSCSDNEWIVHSIQSAPTLDASVSRSPRDITMLIHDTEATFGFQFSSISDHILTNLEV